MENPEGIAIDNTVDPPLLYIATDPSAPHGPSYVPALFTFIKPSIGDGLVYYDPANPPVIAPVSCKGCDQVYQMAEDLNIAYADQKRHKQKMEALAITLPILAGLAFAVVLFGLIAYCYVQKLEKNYGFYGDLPTGPRTSWRKRFSSLFGGKEKPSTEGYLLDGDL